jgi:hypothetical protein
METRCIALGLSARVQLAGCQLRLAPAGHGNAHWCQLKVSAQMSSD